MRFVPRRTIRRSGHAANSSVRVPHRRRIRRLPPSSTTSRAGYEHDSCVPRIVEHITSRASAPGYIQSSAQSAFTNSPRASRPRFQFARRLCSSGLEHAVARRRTRDPNTVPSVDALSPTITRSRSTFGRAPRYRQAMYASPLNTGRHTDTCGEPLRKRRRLPSPGAGRPPRRRAARLEAPYSRAHDIQRPILGLLKDPADVDAEDADRQQLDAPQEQDRHEHRRPAVDHRVRVDMRLMTIRPGRGRRRR